jgi:ParB-like chromosome segregation protein Spo0J
MKTIDVKLDQITIDPTLQPRVSGLDAAHVRELQEAFETCPPIRVVKKGDTYILVDGFHRFAAAQNLQREKIAVEIVDAKDDDDLFALAFSLNAAHGTPLTLSDRRAYATRLLQAHSDWSDREIGRHCGLMQPTVAKVRQDLEQKESIPVVRERTGRDGQKYSMPPKKQPVLHLNKTITPSGRASQRKITDYFMRLADLLEEQDNLPDFKTLTDAVEAFRAVLGNDLASALADRLGWTSYDVLEIAKILGYRKEA